MRKAMSITLVLVLALTVQAFAKPVDETGNLDNFQYMDLSGKASDVAGARHLSMFGAAEGISACAAAAGTTFYGGTYWAADSSRWEAIEDSIWTFDSGVGSNFNHADPLVNPYKNTTLHAWMEGWLGYDNSYSEISYFRRVGVPSTGETRWGAGQVCVGDLNPRWAAHTPAPILGGDYSFWCGVFPAEADELCYATGSGYGNSWVVCVGQTFAYNGSGSSVLEYDYDNETEVGFDFTDVVVDTSGGNGDDVIVVSYTGFASGHANHTLTAGITLPYVAGDIVIKFCMSSDGAWSDEDGLNPTACGAFIFDNVSVNGGGITHSTDFETAADGWARLPAAIGAGEEWSNIVHLQDLPSPLTPCTCALAESVLVMNNLNVGGHNEFSDNLAASPWIDLGPDGWDNQGPGKFIQTNIYAELPLLNYNFVQFNVRWYPDLCLNTGANLLSPWTSNGFVYYFGGVPQCTDISNADTGTRIDFGSFIPPGAEQVQIALGTLSYCRFFANCTGVSNSTPWFDYVKLGVYGSPDAPLIATSTVDVPQDNFPEDGTLRLTSAGRLDANNVKGDSQPETGTALGDTLIVDGAQGGAEVYVQFAVTPGPGVNGGALSSFLSGANVTYEETRYGQEWYSAQMDTAELGGSGAINGTWMTAHIEGSPGFSGTDTSKDPNDLDPNGVATRLENDIFPDNLFTPGTRVNMFFKTQYVSNPGCWFTNPDTSNGVWHEWECLPSSMAADSTFNCVLYVDHFSGRGAQPFIEEALTTLLGTGSANFEQTNWDRWDVQAPSSQQASYGRPLETEYGASIIQTLGYNTIIWNTGNLNAFNLTKEDADVLLPWITLDINANNIYFSGDGIVASPINEGASEPSARKLMEDFAGATLTCGTYRDLGCPAGKALDTTTCVNVDPVGGAKVAGSLGVRGTDHMGQGNGCPQQRSFDVLGANPSPDFGVATPDEIYSTASTSPAGAYASIAIDGTDAGPLSHRIVTDGVSIHYRRDDDGVSPSGDCTFDGAYTVVENRMDEVLTFLGLGGGGTLCSDPTAGIGIGDDPVRSNFRTTLANFAPNPLMTGVTGRIQFTMAREGKANIDIFDVNGRLVTSVFDGIAEEGVNEAFWNGTDNSGRQVASGVYFYRLRAGAEDFSKKMVVVRNGGF